MKRPSFRVTGLAVVFAILSLILVVTLLYDPIRETFFQTVTALSTEPPLATTRAIAIENPTRKAILATQTLDIGATQTPDSITAQAEGDDDGDGLSNNAELQLGTDPRNPDTDDDGLNDGAEVNQYGTHPLNNDTDGDTLTDGDEVTIYMTSPINSDTDADGISDGVEISVGSTPLQPPTESPAPGDPGTAEPAGTATTTPPPKPAVMEIAAVDLEVGMTEEGRFTTQVVGRIGLGTMDFRAPIEMSEGDSEAARLILNLPQGFVAEGSVTIFVTPREAAGSDTLERSEHHVAEDITLFEEMSAHLSGINFDILPDSPVSKHILPGNETVWNWTIKPKNAGSQALQLEIFVLLLDESGEVDKVWIYDNIFPVAVLAAAGQQAPKSAADQPLPSKTAASAAPTQALTPIITVTPTVDMAGDCDPTAVMIIILVIVAVVAGAAAYWLVRRRRESESPSPPSSGTARYTRLHNAMDEHFSEAELKALCFELSVEYANLPAETKTNKVWELIVYCSRTDQVDDLLHLCGKKRPNVDWAL